MKETFYFSHDYNSRNDPKLVNLLRTHKLEGLGVYWCIVEMLYEQEGKIQTTEYERIAFELRTNIETISSIVLDSGLFVIEGGYFFSLSVLERLKKRHEKSQKAKDSIKKRWDRDTNVLPTNYDSNTIKESKVKESKVKESKEVVESSTAAKKIFEILGCPREDFYEQIDLLIEKYPKTDLLAVSQKCKIFQVFDQRWIKFITMCGSEFEKTTGQKQERGITVSD